MIVLIPAYEPDTKLIRLLEDIVETGVGIDVLLVNDGSGPQYDALFDRSAALGCTVIGHRVNRGKGFALKQGFEYVAQHFAGHDVVCADCDGQHSVVDILRVASEVAAHRTAMVLGSRQFTGRVPVASRFGNAVTRVVFARSTGQRLYDTQTGLRGYPASMLSWLQTVRGERFEYELNVLLEAAEAGVTIQEFPVETIYLEGNASSHFRPLVDSARVYAPLVKFSLSSLSAFALDVVLLLVLKGLTGNLFAAVVGARVVSSVFNFVANRRLVFARAQRPLSACATRYVGLVAAVMTVNYTSMYGLYERLGAGLLPSKLVTEAGLFVASYEAQKRFVFARRSSAPVVSGSAAPVRRVEPERAAGPASVDGGSLPSARLARRG
ncbi:MAG: bifunctional glycosyltransferase family 2/GtrA family protein [Acidimicrobiales bacterium]